ncbi:MAG: type IIL restriction-modification enzyme MmeI [Anaerolineaceae bacterium]
MTPKEFINLWKDNKLTERGGAQAHFDDLCDLLGVDKPRDPDNYCFEQGATKAGGGDGWADVWKRGCFGWENKKPGRDLSVALHQLTDYALQLENPSPPPTAGMVIPRTYPTETSYAACWRSTWSAQR